MAQKGFRKDKGKKEEEKRALRKGSFISPYGVGAIVPFGTDESIMISDINSWEFGNSIHVIEDDRLKNRLGISELREPPAKDDASGYLSIYARGVRFPSNYYCPKCGHMKLNYSLTAHEQPTCETCKDENGKNIKMIPDRFVVVCPKGHIDNFPVSRWVHARGRENAHSDQCSDKFKKIYRSVGRSSGYGEDVWYECKNCGAKVAMVGAVGKGKLANIYSCSGRRPWLGDDGKEDCSVEGSVLYVIPKGSTNVYFPLNVSSIYLPASKETISFSPAEMNLLKKLENDEDRSVAFGIIAAQKNVTQEDVRYAYEKEVGGNSSTIMKEGDYRFQEYVNLTRTCGTDSRKSKFYCINRKIEDYDDCLHEYFKSISIVPKLQETRAFVGFSRLEPLEKYDVHETIKQLSRQDVFWLPAIQVYGEGIFFEFNKEKLKSWASDKEVVDRVLRMNKGFHETFQEDNPKSTLKPEFVLIHTFAHLLIKQLSFECGYGSSALREKIYCEKANGRLDMYGVLIYTASSDSEGSMGGLVKQGHPGAIEDIIINALKGATWCSSDPVCIESKGQGMSSCNLAACHNCTLLPETSCENMNYLLDRGVVVGTLSNPRLGYFRDLIDNNQIP